MTKEEKIQILQRCVEGIDALNGLNSDAPGFQKWKRDTEVGIERVFTVDTRHIHDFKRISFSTPRPGLAAQRRGITPTATAQNALAKGQEQARAIIQSMMEEIATYDDGLTQPREPTDTNPDIWNLLHPKIVVVAQPRFHAGHLADSVEAALKEVNSTVKNIVKLKIGKELDGASLMNTALSVNNPILKLDDPSTLSGKDIQQGYMQIFAGAMTGVRNPKAHGNIAIDENQAIHLLFLASLLMYKVEEAKV